MLHVSGLINKVTVQKYAGSHGLYHGHGSGHYAGVVAPARFEGDGLAVGVHGLLILEYGGYRLEGYAEVYVLPVGDAALYASAAIGERGDASAAVGREDVVLL